MAKDGQFKLYVVLARPSKIAMHYRCLRCLMIFVHSPYNPFKTICFNYTLMLTRRSYEGSFLMIILQKMFANTFYELTT